MIGRQICKYFHNSAFFWSVNKSDLAKLRKKTGYTFANCKKALEVSNNLEEAEKWLKEQAQSLGWAKANKLEGRKTSQGLVGVTVKDNCAVVVEVNCETDFVARNKKFRSFVELSVTSCLTQALNIKSGSLLKKTIINNEELKSVLGPEGKNLSDLSALTISDLGENINLRRAIYIHCPGSMQLAAYAHPNSQGSLTNILTGRYGAVVAYVADTYDAQRQQWAQQLCQHVVGMNPKEVGLHGEDEPAANKDDEHIMIYQDFLLDPEVSVNQFLADAGIRIIDFVRVECGEDLEVNENQVSLKATG